MPSHILLSVRLYWLLEKVSVTGDWRITFEFTGQDVLNGNLEDYH